jgi:uncharacterized protein YuzE
VELADERERHIAERHPELLPAHLVKIEQTLAQPDQIRRSGRFASARLFSRRFNDLLGGKHVVVVVLDSSSGRNWIHYSLHRAQYRGRRCRMEAKLSFKYDRAADILYINKRDPYPTQESEELPDEVVVRLNPETGEIENVEVLFFSTRLLRGDLFELPVTADLRIVAED